MAQGFFLLRLTRWVRVALGLLLGIGLTIGLWSTHAQASPRTVLLQYQDQYLTLPIEEFQRFAEGSTPNPDLQVFLTRTHEEPADVRRWLSTSISPDVGRLLPTDFVLYQLNKTVGEDLSRGDLAALQTALRASFRDDGTFSMIEVLQNYPTREVRLTLDSLEQAYENVYLVLTRLEPVLEVVEKLLPELICNCSSQTAPGTPTGFAKAHQAVAGMWELPTENSARVSAARSPTASLASVPGVKQQTDRPYPAPAESQRAPNPDRSLVFVFGAFRPAITVGDLTRFAETGELSRGWRNYLGFAGIDPEDFRKALTQEVAADLVSLDHLLHTLPGELLLYKVGEILQTPTGNETIEALRSAIILSLADDNRLSLLELLQNYPTSRILVNGTRLARLGKNLRAQKNPEELLGAVLDVEGWFVHIQASGVDDLCSCERNPYYKVFTNILGTPPQISAAQTRAFLPENWQPVPAHREERGIIKVVWLQGTPYEMGYQHGQLLHDEIASLDEEVIRIAGFVGRSFGLSKLAQIRTYPDLLEECQGLVDATQDIGITLDVCAMMAYADVFQEILGYTLPKELFWDGCNQFVATGAATADGKLYHGSSVDNDGEAIAYVLENPVIFVRQPNQGLPHVFVTYPGVIWPNSGMNVAGITLGLDTAHPNSPDELALIGRSNVQIMAKILQNASTFAEASSILRNQPRVRANLIMVTDGKSQAAGVFEFTGRNLGIRPLQENGVLYVTNHFELPDMVRRQAMPIDLSSVSRFDRLAQLLEPDQAEGADSLYGRIDPAGMARILRDRTNPYTGVSSPLDVLDDDASPGGNGALRQAIYDPEGLRLWIAAGQPPVPENPFVCFSMGGLLGFPDAVPCEQPSL